VASLTVSPTSGAYLSLYPVLRADFPESAVSEFNTSVLPQFRAWLTARLSRPEIEVSGHVQIIAEWVDGGYRLHQLRYQYNWN
jgi:hypothetical protein